MDVSAFTVRFCDGYFFGGTNRGDDIKYVEKATTLARLRNMSKVVLIRFDFALPEAGGEPESHLLDDPRAQTSDCFPFGRRQTRSELDDVSLQNRERHCYDHFVRFQHFSTLGLDTDFAGTAVVHVCYLPKNKIVMRTLEEKITKTQKRLGSFP